MSRQDCSPDRLKFEVFMSEDIRPKKPKGKAYAHLTPKEERHFVELWYVFGVQSAYDRLYAAYYWLIEKIARGRINELPYASEQLKDEIRSAAHHGFAYCLDRKAKRFNPERGRLSTALQRNRKTGQPGYIDKLINEALDEHRRKGFGELPTGDAHVLSANAPIYDDEGEQDGTFGDTLADVSSLEERGPGWLRWLPEELKTIVLLKHAGLTLTEIAKSVLGKPHHQYARMAFEDAMAQAQAILDFPWASIAEVIFPKTHHHADVVSFLADYTLYNVRGIGPLRRDGQPAVDQNRPGKNIKLKKLHDCGGYCSIEIRGVQQLKAVQTAPRSADDRYAYRPIYSQTRVTTHPQNTSTTCIPYWLTSAEVAEYVASLPIVLILGNVPVKFAPQTATARQWELSQNTTPARSAFLATSYAS
jgi:hypothetical protein